jgi:pimeloyl-ACP methyl ester carboxylesterase
LHGHFNSTTRRVESKEEIFCPQDVEFGLYAIDTLDAESMFPQARYFHSLIIYLKQMGYVPGKTLFGFCYDWRQRIGDRQLHEQLLRRIEHVRSVTETARIDLISHSMGGLLLKSFFRRYAEAAWLVRNWVALATPWRGTPARAVAALVSGDQLGHILVSRASARRMSATMPVAFQIIADAAFAARDGSVPRVSFKLGGQWRSMSVEQFLELLPMRNDSSAPYLADGRVTFDATLRALVARDRRRWQSFEIPRAVDAPLRLEGASPMLFFNAYAVGVATPFDVTFEVDVRQPDELFQLDVVDRTLFSHVDGDGSVPISSGMDDGLEAAARVPVYGEHLEVMQRAAFARHVGAWLGVACTLAGTWHVVAGGGDAGAAHNVWRVATTVDERHATIIGPDDTLVAKGTLDSFWFNGVNVFHYSSRHAVFFISHSHKHTDL